MIISGTVRAGDISMAYARIGQGEKTFVILPGLSLKPVVPAAQAVATAYAKVAEQCTIYVFDRRENMPENYSVRDMATDTAAVMKTLGIENTFLFGASQGGMIAQYIAALYPELVRGLICGSTSQHLDESARTVFNKWISLAENRDFPALAANIADTMYGEATLARFRNILIAGNSDATEDQRRSFLICAGALLYLDTRPIAKDIHCPALVIGCQGDKVLGVQASRLLAESLQCELQLYGPEYGHAVYDEAPDYTQRIADFIACH